MPSVHTSSFSERAASASRFLGVDRTATPLMIALVLLLTVGGVIVWLVESSAEQSRLVFGAFEVQRTVSRLYRIVQGAETGQRGYLLTGEDRYLATYDAGVSINAQAIDDLLKATAVYPEQSADALALKDLVSRKLAELRNTIDLRKAGKADEALALVRTDVGRSLMDEIRATTDRIQGRAVRSISVEYQQGQSLDRLMLILTLGALIGILLLGAFVIRLNRLAVRSVEESRAATVSLNETLEQAVTERTAELIESNEEIQRFAYIVSHDLRAPLVNIMGFTAELESLREDILHAALKPEGDPARARVETEFDESIGFIKAAINKMEGLIAAILRLSREGRRTFRPERIDTSALCESLSDAQRHQTDAAGATVAVAKNLPVIVADRVALEQIFGNLIDNAIKYLDPSRPGRIEVVGETIGERARISVRDNGRGIAEHDHRRVFELFRRSGEQNRPGDGIGLAHVQTLVRSLGGRISLASELGKGTTFTVVLPLAPKAASLSKAA